MRLIDADALPSVVGTQAELPGLIVKAIQDAPTIDAVPVVRCKDCRWHEQEQPGMVYCPNIVGGWVEDNWFCKGGEWKEYINENSCCV